MRLGVFGGSFDPVHRGHLRLAEAARDQAGLDKLLLIPAASQPLKPGGAVATGQQRLEMLRLAIDGLRGLEASSLEIDRGGVSYTADTLQHLADKFPQAHLFFLLGADALTDLAQWRQPEVIVSLATLLVVARPNHALPDVSFLHSLVPRERRTETLVQRLEMIPDTASSSEIRRRISLGLSWRELTLPSVAQFIEAQGLYRRAAD